MQRFYPFLNKLGKHTSLHLFVCVLTLTSMARAGIIEEEFDERKGHICEPALLPRRVAESAFSTKQFLDALENNSVFLSSKNGKCSGTFITSQCVLTAAHCLNTLEKNDAVSASRNGFQIRGGISHFDGDYGTKDQKSIVSGTISGDDLGVVVFKKGYAAFKPLSLSAVMGNLNLWFNGASKADAMYTGGLSRFEQDYWRNLGNIGLTGYTAETTNGDWGICSDSAFQWSPCLTYRDASEPPTFERGVVCVTGEFGSGMSGGSFYNDTSLFGILIEEIASSNKRDNTVKNHWWKSNPRSTFSSNAYQGISNRVKILSQRDKEFIGKYCPDANFIPLKSSKGPAVKDSALVKMKADNQFWLSGGEDVWRKLKPDDRWTRVNVPLRKGNRGEFVRRLHERLRNVGIKAPLANEYNAETELAIRKFQHQNHIPETGQSDQVTLTKMGIWFNQRN